MHVLVLFIFAQGLRHVIYGKLCNQSDFFLLIELNHRIHVKFFFEEAAHDLLL